MITDDEQRSAKLIALRHIQSVYLLWTSDEAIKKNKFSDEKIQELKLYRDYLEKILPIYPEVKTESFDPLTDIIKQPNLVEQPPSEGMTII
jgi:hypothetical protein